MAQCAQERAIIFIDGNNFYNAMKRSDCYSHNLNYEAFSRKLVQDRKWIATRYYIGQIPQDSKGLNKQQKYKQNDLYKKQRQFLAGLSSFNRVQYFFGRLERKHTYLPKQLSNWLANLPEDLSPEVSKISKQLRKLSRIPTYVEKAVDVQIAVDMITMAHRGEYDVAYLLSADGDFTPVVKEILKIGSKVFVASPAEGAQLARAVGHHRYIRMRRDFFDGCWL